MAAPESTPPRPHREVANRRGLSWKEKWLIAGFLIVGLVLAAVSMLLAPVVLVSEQDYPCPPAATTGSSQATTSGPSPSCLGRAGGDGIDHQALDQARAAVRAPFGVLSAGLLAGAAAAIGVVISNHNAALTRDALNVTVVANESTKQRDRETATRESDRDHASAARDRAAAARERERAADDRFTAAIDQLGHSAASVRLGAMHSLHRLAKSDLGRVPTVVDVLCAYLRQPFHHPDHDWYRPEHGPEVKRPARAWWPDTQKERDERDSEREVRSTATRLMPDLLPHATTPPLGDETPSPEASEAPRPLEINLNGAMLDGLDLSGRRTGGLRLNSTYLAGDLILGDGAHIDDSLILDRGAHITGDLILDRGAHITGDLILDRGAHIDGSLRITDCARIDGGLRLDDGAHITRDLWLRGGHITGDVRLSGGAHINGRFWLTGGAHITGNLRLDSDAYIINELWLGDGTHIDGRVWLTDKAYIGGDFRLDDETHIDGQITLTDGAHIDGDFWLDDGAHIDGGLKIGPDAYIYGNVSTDGADIARKVQLHPKAAMKSDRFYGWDITMLQTST